MRARKSVVVGGGFVGLSSALHLQKIGRSVTLVDRANAGSAAAASYGNAGTMAAYACVPVNSPSLLRKLPSMLMDDASPVSVKPTPHLASMLPWASLFAMNCRPAAVERTAAGLGALLSRAESGYEAVWKQAGVDVDAPMGEHAASQEQRERPYATRNGQGHLFLMRSAAAMKESAAAADLRTRHVANLRAHALSQEEVLALEPALSPEACAGGAWFFPDGWFLNEPGALLRALASGFETNGGDLRTGAAVTAIGGADGGGATVMLDDRTMLEADEVVIAAGAHSGSLVAGSLGEWCPLDTERGYHVAFEPGTEQLLSRGVTDASSGWIATPMAGGLRIAGKVELGGLRAPPSPARWRRIEAEARETIAGVGARVPASDWMGFRPTVRESRPTPPPLPIATLLTRHLSRPTPRLIRHPTSPPPLPPHTPSHSRPSQAHHLRCTFSTYLLWQMPDSLPVIGRSSTLPSVLYAFGHHHVGWTLGGITGQVIAEIAQGLQPSVDVTPYALDRFRPWAAARRGAGVGSPTPSSIGGASVGSPTSTAQRGVLSRPCTSPRAPTTTPRPAAVGRRASTSVAAARRGLCSVPSAASASRLPTRGLLGRGLIRERGLIRQGLIGRRGRCSAAASTSHLGRRGLCSTSHLGHRGLCSSARPPIATLPTC